MSSRPVISIDIQRNKKNSNASLTFLVFPVNKGTAVRQESTPTVPQPRIPWTRRSNFTHELVDHQLGV